MSSDSNATPTPISNLLDATRTGPILKPAWTNLCRRLVHEFGFGDQKRARLQLYANLERLCHQHGMPVYRHVRDCARTARTKDCPDHWFCVAVRCRLQDCGYPI